MSDNNSNQQRVFSRFGLNITPWSIQPVGANAGTWGEFSLPEVPILSYQEPEKFPWYDLSKYETGSANPPQRKEIPFNLGGNDNETEKKSDPTGEGNNQMGTAKTTEVVGNTNTNTTGTTTGTGNTNTNTTDVDKEKEKKDDALKGTVTIKDLSDFSSIGKTVKNTYDLLKNWNSTDNLGKIGIGAQVFGNIANIGNAFYDDSNFASNSIRHNSTINAIGGVASTLNPYTAAIWNTGKFAGNIGSSTSKDFNKNIQLINNIGGNYADAVNTINEAENVSNKKFSLWDFGKRHSANRRIDSANILQYAMEGINQQKQDLEDQRTMVDPYNLNYQFRMQGGMNPMASIAKNGGNLNLNDYYNFITDSPKKYKKGGKVDNIEVIETDTTQKSVIPEGALHKNKHHLDKVGLDDSEITKKGIPVIDNQGNQQAEIELNEIIFTLEVTKELEKRYKEYYEKDTSQSRKDELALEAGKLLWKEILYNTDDRTGLIDTLKTGGTIQQKNVSSKVINNTEKFKSGGNSKTLNLSYDFISDIIPSKYYYACTKQNVEDLLSFLKEGGTVTFAGDSVKELQESGDYTFITEDPSKINKEVEEYVTGKNGLYKTHNLIYDDNLNKYVYKAKKYALGGITTYTAAVNTDKDEAKKQTEEKLQTWYEMLYPNYDKVQKEEIKNSTQPTLKNNSISLPDPKDIVNNQIPTNLNLDGWDIEKTLQHLRSHAHDKSTHYCARYVRQALEAGGLKGFRVPNARDEVKLNTLKTIGFVKVADAIDNEYSVGYTPQAGDISITYENGNHAAMYDGTQWISDFRQNGVDVYRRRKGSKIAIYRRTGNTNYSPQNTIFINKSKRTLTVNGQTFKVSISKNGIGTSTKKGDNLTPEGTFTIGEEEKKGGYQDAQFGWRPDAFGGKFFRINGGSAEGRGFGIHGSDKYNDPDNYKEGVYGTHGCIAMKNEDLSKLEQIIKNNGGVSKFKVQIVKQHYGGSLNRVRNFAKSLHLK